MLHNFSLEQFLTSNSIRTKIFEWKAFIFGRMMDYFFIGILIIFLSGFVAKFIAEKYKVIMLATANMIGAGFCMVPAIRVLNSGQNLVKSFNFNELFGNVIFQIDYLSAFFILIICIMGILSIFYAKGYLQSYKGKSINAHLVFFQMLLGSMLTVVTCHNAIGFLICWEIMSLSSFFLVNFEHEKKEVLNAGISYLVFMHISVIFIMLAFAILSTQAHSFDFAAYTKILSANRGFANIILLLFFIGFGTKAGFVPFHNWLPEAHPAAPSHVSAIMSGVMIKTGIYGILRVISWVGVPSKEVGFIILTISLITAIYGILYAIMQNDIKKLLAYSSIENIGIIGVGLGVGLIGMAYNHPLTALLGYCGCLFHILNHSIFKELLFLSAGSVYIKTHTKDMEKLGGLIKKMPYTGILFLIASIAICGLPPFNGFVSEFLIYIGMFQGLSVKSFFFFILMLLGIAGLALVGTLALLCFTKAFSIIFLGFPRDELHFENSKECTATMLLPMAILAVLILIVGLFPDYVVNIILKPVQILIGDVVVMPEKMTAVLLLMKIIAKYSFLLLVVIVGTVLIKLKLTKRRIAIQDTWGCGYDNPNNHMQYTASSYTSPLLSMLTPLFKKVFDIEKPRKVFPSSSHFNLQIEDIEKAYIINPLVKYDEWFLSKFESLQSGNIQAYIKYGLIFLVLIIIGSLLIK